MPSPAFHSASPLPPSRPRQRALLRACETPPTTHTERNVTFTTHPHTFYRPTSARIRDLGVLALATLPLHSHPPPYTVLDACAASGVRTLRYLAPPANAAHVQATDTHSLPLHAALLRNLHPHLLSGRATASNTAFENLPRHTQYDLVDADLFGPSGEPTVSVILRFVRNGGLLYLCATDAPAANGVRGPQAGFLPWGAVTGRLHAGNEVLLRAMLGSLARAAAVAGRAVHPVAAWFERRSATGRVLVRVARGRQTPADFGWMRECPACGETVVAGLGELPGVGVCACGAACAVSGPVWVGEVQDARYLDDMIAQGEEAGWREAVDVLHGLRAEAGLRAGYFALGEIGRRIGGDLPAVAEIDGVLQRDGFRCARAMGSARCIKTDASFVQLVAAADVAAAERRAGLGGSA